MGWNGSGNAASASSSRTNKPAAPKRRTGLIAGLVVVIGAAGAFFFLSRSEAPKPTAKEVEKPTAIQEVKPTIAKPAVEPVTTNAAGLKIDPRYPYTDGREVLSSTTNNFDQIIDICKMPNGRTRKVIRNARPQVFHNASDQVIAMALSGSPDSELPPIPLSHDMERDFVESLKTPIVINPDDSDAIKQAKQNVIEAREYIDAEMRKGRGFYDIMTEHIAMRKGNAELRAEAMKTALELKKSGDTEGLYKYLDKVNGLLRENGIGEIQEPMTRREKRGLQQ